MTKRIEFMPVSRLIVDGIEWKVRPDDGRPVGDVKRYFESRRLCKAGRVRDAQALYKQKET